MGLSPDRAAGSTAARLAGYGAVSTSLALLSDRRLGKLVEEAPVIGSGIGGTAVLLEIEGTPVFAKRVPLTDLERRPEHVMSTANLFQLPTFCQYGVGAPGFGVWRELAANAMTTNWVLGQHCESFPLMYHWRVLPGPPPRPSMAEERAEQARTVEYWAGSAAVRARLEAIARSSASVVLFLEYVPQNLQEWLTAQVARGADAVESACVLVERSLRTDVWVAVVVNEFYWKLHVESRTTAYPVEDIERVCAATGFEPGFRHRGRVNPCRPPATNGS